MDLSVVAENNPTPTLNGALKSQLIDGARLQLYTDGVAAF